MTSVALSAVLFVISFVVLMILVMRGMNLIPAAIIASAILAFGVDGGFFDAIFTQFSSGAGGYCTNLIVCFMMGGMFSGCMIGTGSDVVLGRVLINKFGIHAAIYTLGVFVAICGFVGIQSWPFLSAVFAFSLMKAADLPLNVACVVMVGVNSAFSFMLPGSPTVANLIASQVLGTSMYDGAVIGVVMCVVQVVLVYLYVEFKLVRGYRKAGIGYTPSKTEESMRADANSLKEEEMPSFIEAIIPLLVVVLGCVILQFGAGLDSTPATCVAQTAAIVVCILLNVRRGFLKKLWLHHQRLCPDLHAPADRLRHRGLRDSDLQHFLLQCRNGCHRQPEDESLHHGRSRHNAVHRTERRLDGRYLPLRWHGRYEGHRSRCGSRSGSQTDTGSIHHLRLHALLLHAERDHGLPGPVPQGCL